jgi:hypothetical protein
LRKKKLYCNSISPKSEWQSSKKQTTNASEDAGEKESLYTVGRNEN